jgi:hypothetical protein
LSKHPRKRIVVPELYLPHRKTLTPAYLPKASHLPPGDLRMLAFDIPAVNARQTVEKSKTLEHRFLCWAICATDSDAAGFRVQIYHLHDGKQTSFFSRHMVNTDVTASFATAARPTILPVPKVFEQGDTLTVEVRNLSTADGGNIQVVLWGADIQ